MSEIIFIEGVSGVGKSTMVQSLSDSLCKKGYEVRHYVEFDFTNPIDFYCTAYFTCSEYNALCERHKESMERIKQYSVPAGKAVLVRYYDEDTPLFKEPLLKEMICAEFCYNPTHLIPLQEYTEVYKAVWQGFVANMAQDVQYYIFDGSLLHHPINDMMRNYHADAEQAGVHVKEMLDILSSVKWHLYYLYTDNISKQLTLARKNRGQKVPTQDEIIFWENRYKNDKIVLNDKVLQYETYNVSELGWNKTMEKILLSL